MNKDWLYIKGKPIINLSHTLSISKPKKVSTDTWGINFYHRGGYMSWHFKSESEIIEIHGKIGSIIGLDVEYDNNEELDILKT